MLDIDKIRQLVEMMVVNDLVEISLRDGEEEVNLRRPGPRVEVPFPASGTGMPLTGSVANLSESANPAVEPAQMAEDSELIQVSAPMVGTFYAAADPESPAFVGVGSEVQPGMVLCILEAMKVFNEIKAEVAGTIEGILVKNAEPVEYGQPLFAIRPV